VVQVLLQHQANLSLVDDYNFTAMDYAQSFESILSLLKETLVIIIQVE
jgi:hypothetical protein